MRLSIRTKLLLTFVAATLVGLAVLAVGVVAPFILIWNRAAPTGVSFAQMIHLMEGRYDQIQDAILRGEEVAALRRVAVPDDLPAGIRVQLIDPEGLVLVDSTGQEGRRLTAAEMLGWFRGVRPESSQALALPQPLSKPDGSLWGYYVVDIPGFAAMNINIGDGSPESALAGWLMGGGALLALVVTLLLFWFFGLHLVRPVRRLSEVVGRIAGGDLSARSNLGNRRDELGQLARDVDLMAARLQEAGEQARAMERSRRYLVAAASHDLRTPLTALLAHVEALRNGVSDDPDKSLAVIEEKGQRLKHLIDDLFLLSSLDAASEPWQTLRVDLAELIRQAVIGVLPDVEARGIRLETEIPEAPCYACLAPGKIERVMDNLLANALKYGQGGNWLGVRLERRGDRLRVEVADRGPGIPPADQARLFERFYRSDEARTSAVDGSGLGLAIAREIILRHGGEIGAQSPPEGGSLFWFEVPAWAGN